MVVGMARSMIKAKSMPVEFWGKAVTAAVLILNRASMKSLKGVTPFEAWYEHKRDVSFLTTFSCFGYVKKTKLFLTKLEDRSTLMVLLATRQGGKEVVSHDVMFDEKMA